MLKDFTKPLNKNNFFHDVIKSDISAINIKEKSAKINSDFSIDIPLNKYDNLDNLLTHLSSILNHGNYLSGYFYSNSYYKKNMKARNPYFLFKLKYAGSVLYHRVLPKLVPLLRFTYMKISMNKEKFLSNPEVVGRLFKYGFKVLDFREVDKVCYFKAQKQDEPDHTKANLWPICKMKRISKNGELKTFYKLRTMHAYSEYMQEFIYLKNGLKGGDKFKNDSRIPLWGKILRKYWLDEFPMIINLIKGDLKLIGPRPLTIHKFGLYSEELQQLRIKFKPGLLPPFYADLPKTLEELMESEKKYLLSYEKNGWKTDVEYLLKIIENIIIKKARSK